MWYSIKFSYRQLGIAKGVAWGEKLAEGKTTVHCAIKGLLSKREVTNKFLRDRSREETQICM